MPSIIVGNGSVLDKVAYAALTAIKSNPIVSRGNRSKGVSIWTMSTRNGSYQIQIYVPSGTELPEEFLEAQWKDYGSVKAITAMTLHKFNEEGGFPALRVVFTPSAQPGTVTSIVSFYGGA